MHQALDKTREAYRSFRTVPAPRRGEILRQIREALASKVSRRLYVSESRLVSDTIDNVSENILVLLFLLRWVKLGQKVSAKFKSS